MRWLRTPDCWRTGAKRSNAAFQVVRSLIGCSMCRVDMRAPFARLTVAHGRREGFSSQIPGVWRDTAHVAVSASRGRSRERIMRLCGSLVDARTLRLELLEELNQIVPFDAYAWLLTDPQTSVGSSPLADVPCPPELPRLIRLKYLTEVNRWTHLRSPVALLAAVTGGDLSRSLVWRELLHRYDIVDVTSVRVSGGGLSRRHQRSCDHRPAPQSSANLQGPGGTARAEPWSGHVAAVASPRCARTDRRDPGIPTHARSAGSGPLAHSGERLQRRRAVARRRGRYRFQRTNGSGASGWRALADPAGSPNGGLPSTRCS